MEWRQFGRRWRRGVGVAILVASGIATFDRSAAAADSAARASRPIVNIDLSGNGPDLAASVPDIAIDPRNHAHVAVVWRFISMPKGTEDLSSRTWVCHLSLSSDGGAHFSDEVVDWNTPDTPKCNATYVDVAANGELYIGATLSAKSPNNRPPGYVPFGRVVIRRSSNWGWAWSATTSVIATGNEDRFAPNPAVPVEAEHIPWDGARGVVDQDNGDIYVSGGFPAPPGGAAYSQRFYSVSSDGGKTWGAIRAFGAPGWPQRWDGHIVAAHGELAFSYVAAAVPQTGAKCPCVVFGTSADHGVTVFRHYVAQVRGLDTLVHYPPIAADPGRQGAFALSVISEDGKAVSVLTSSDNGASWTPATSLIEPPDVVRASRPALTYAPNGALVVMWRGYHADGSFDIYAAGTAGGRGFGAPLRLTTAESRVPGDLMSDYAVRGDFIDVAAADPQFLHAAWTDWRSGAEAEVYYGSAPLSLLLSKGP